MTRFLTLNEFLTPGLLKPFYYLTLGLTGLGTLFGLLGGFGLMFFSPISGLFTIMTTLLFGAVSAISIRFFCELYLAVFRLHDRFVGGHPKDGLPEG